MKILITICGRGGSKGIPGKNIKPINGVPLIAYSILCAQQLAQNYNCDIALSSDDNDIIRTAAQYNIRTDYIRPEGLATDHAGKLDVIKDVLLYYEQKNGLYDIVIDLDITSPLRTLEDISQGLKILLANSEAVNLFSVNKANKNPYFNMVEQQDDGFYNLVKQGNFLTRQSSPKVYELNASFYIFKRSFFDLHSKAITPKSLIYVMPHLCFDLDEPHDFEFLAYLMEHNKLDFKL